MILTVLQHSILSHVDDLKTRVKLSGKRSFYLNGKDVSTTVNSLIVKELLTSEDNGKRVALTSAGTTKLRLHAGLSPPDAPRPAAAPFNALPGRIRLRSTARRFGAAPK